MFNHNIGICQINNNLFFINKQNGISMMPFEMNTMNKILFLENSNLKKTYLKNFYQNYFYYLKILPKYSKEEIEDFIIHNYGAWYEDGNRIEHYSEYFPPYYFLLEFDDAISCYSKTNSIIINENCLSDRRMREIKITEKNEKKINKNSVKYDIHVILKRKLKKLTLKELNYILKNNNINDWSNKKNIKIELIVKNLSIEETNSELNKIKYLNEKSKKIEDFLNRFNITKLRTILNEIDSNVFNNALYFNKESDEIIFEIMQILPYEKFDWFLEFLNDLIKNPTCKVCGKKLDRWSKNEACRDCNKMIHACTILINLRNIIGELGFRKKDLEGFGYNTIEANDAIWTLQTYDLLKEKEGLFYLEDYDKIEEFEKEWKEYVDPEKIKNTGKIFFKTCKACGKNKKVSEFAKSRKTIDNYNDFCKDCNKKIITAKNLIEIMKHMNPLEEFSLSDLEVYYPEEFLRMGIIYSLQDNDLLEQKGELYRLKQKYILEEFLNKWGRFTEDNTISYDEEVFTEHMEKYIKEATKMCEICGTETKSKNNICKSCKNKIHACKLLIGLLDEIDFKEEFNKDSLINLGYNKMESLDIIWTLKENKLIKKEENNYVLEDISDLENFIGEWEIYI